MHQAEIYRVLVIVELLGSVEWLHVPARNLSGSRLGGYRVMKDFVIVVVT